MNEVVYKELSYKIVGILFDVYNELGAGHLEKNYQNALVIAFKKNNLKFEEQVFCKLEYSGEKLGHFYLDFLIEDKIVLEIKRHVRFSTGDFDQIKNYLKVTGLRLGILATFSNNSVKYSRILNLY